jgi:hypothetical protein
MKILSWLLSMASLLVVGCSVEPGATGTHSGGPSAKPASELHDTDILIIRHAEKPDSGPGLSPAGQARADAYVRYFKTLSLGSRSLTPDRLIAGADSARSWRPRLTLEPLSQALSLPIDLKFTNAQGRELAEFLRGRRHGRCILICWRHGGIPDLVSALGADPGELLPEGKWPDDEFAWLLHLRYGQEGHLIPGGAKRIPEALMPGDSK